MTRKTYTYSLYKIIVGIVVWEIIFWILYYVVTNALGYFSDSGATERLLYKSPGTLTLLFLMIPATGVYIYNLAKHNKASKHLTDRVKESYLRPVSTGYTFLKFWFFRNAFVFLIIALAQPVFGKRKASGTVDNLELVVCLDISNSMNTKDISKDLSRLEISKRALIQLVNNLHGERIGICLFANNAFVQLPVTKDYGAAKLFIKDIETDMISNQGTNIDAALNVALDMFSKERTAKGIIMVTDGENHETDPSEVLQKIKESDVQISVLGIGTKKGGLVPKNPHRPELGYKTTATGKSVVSKLNEQFIYDIASKAGGKATLTSSEFPDLSGLLTEINNMKRTKINNLEFDIQQERYQIPVILSLAFWLLYLLWSRRYAKMVDKLIESK